MISVEFGQSEGDAQSKNPKHANFGIGLEWKLNLEVKLGQICKPKVQTENPSDFKVLKEISRGTMSTVYYCEGNIALKSMSEEGDVGADAVAIYQNDFKVLGSLGDHPYIVRLINTTDEAMITHVTTGKVERVRNCQVLEALHGGELFYHIVRNGPFSKHTSRGFLK